MATLRDLQEARRRASRPRLRDLQEARAQLVSASPSVDPQTTPFRPWQRIGPAIVEEAAAGRKQFQSAFEPEVDHELSDVPVVGPVVSGGIRAARAGIGALRSAFPIPGGVSKAIAEEPVARVTGSPVTGKIAGAVFPAAGFGVTKIPALGKAISKMSPVKQLAIVEAGGDAPAVPSLANIGKGGGKTKGLQTSFTLDDVAKDDFKVSRGAREKLASIGAEKFGFIFTKGERTGSRFEQQLETATETFPGASFDKVREANKVQLSRAATERAGNPTDEISDAWLNKTREEIGKRMESLSKSSGPVKTEEFLRIAKENLPGPIQKAERARIQSTLNIIEKEYGPEISGPQYAEIRQQLGEVARTHAVSNPDLARRYRSLAETLDDAMDQSIGKGTQRDEWRKAREHYKNYLIIEASTDRGSGLIDPNKFAREVSKSYKKAGRVPIGDNDMVDLATIIKTFRNQIPSSGTAERTAGIQQIKSIIGGGLAGAAVFEPSTLASIGVAKALRARALRGSKKGVK